MTAPSRSRRAFALSTLLLLTASPLAVRQAAAGPIITGPLTVIQREDGFEDLEDVVDTLTSDGTAELSAFDGSHIGTGYMLDGEFIDVHSAFGENTILFSLKSAFFGADYGSSAEYRFEQIAFDAPAFVAGVALSSPDGLVEGFLDAVSFTATSIVLHLGALDVTAGPDTNDIGQLLMTITVEPRAQATDTVPEPSLLALIGLGLTLGHRRLRRVWARTPR